MGVGVAKLRINDIPASAGQGRRVEVTWEDGRAAPRVAVTEFNDAPDMGDGERIRWYLEDYAEFPADPAPALAQAAEARLARTGEDLFRQVFSGADATGIWERARDQLSEVRVEVDTDPGAGPGLAWELLRDPDRDAAVALDAGAFVRTHRQAAGHPDLPEPSGDRLRVLLVICRPGGRQDVPFRSVASRLVLGGADQMDGLDLDVLRPPTFARLTKVLRAAHKAGRPYHVVHFDGHGTYLDLSDLGFTPDGGGGGGGGGGALLLTTHMYGISVAGPLRHGQHGYLLFEDPDTEENQQLVDGPALGRLLITTGVPVLVLNACRSAYTEARDQPGGDGAAAPGGTGTGEAAAGAEAALTEDVHARIRAYGSLAAEVADIGVPGVVAMRYNVYVVTAAQYMADLYENLLTGLSLGQAATEARKALADDPMRQIGAAPVELQDWAVPVVYEAAPLELLRPRARTASRVKIDPGESGAGGGAARPGELPRPPDAGFFGRDETLLALDRAFDDQSIVLLHAYAGAGKSSTAAEFATWYQATGGLDLPGDPDYPGVVLWSSFEHHFTADRAVSTAGDFFAPLLAANDIQWQAVTDPGKRRNYVMQVLARLPVLWIWDNIEPITGFPSGNRSDWTQAEQDDLLSLLRDLAQQTMCKVLLTSRRDEQAWLGNLAARVQLPAMPMRESLQLAAELAKRHGHPVAGADWRPLLRYAAGNPLAITVLVGQALRETLATTEEIENFVARLRAGEAQLEEGEDAALGRTRSLAASLSYGFAQAFTDTERAQLAALHLFRDTADADALRYLGSAGEDAVPELAGLTREAAIALLDRAAGIGLLESIGAGYYHIHPALPWYFKSLFTSTYGQPDGPAARRAVRAYVKVFGDLSSVYHDEAQSGRAAEVIPVLRIEEANLVNALDLARTVGDWEAAIGCLQGLMFLYERTGRDSEWARLIAAITPDLTDPATGGPLPGREGEWGMVTNYRVRIAADARDWPAANTLMESIVAFRRTGAEPALKVPPETLTELQRNQIALLAATLNDLAEILRLQNDPACLPPVEEAIGLYRRIGDRTEEAQDAGTLGNAYVTVPKLRDLDLAEYWFNYSLSLRPEGDQLGRARCLSSLGRVALERFEDASGAGEPTPVLLKHLNEALSNYRQSLALTPVDDHDRRAIVENQLGNIYRRAGDTRQAMRHYEQAIQHCEAQGDRYRAGLIRLNTAVLLSNAGRTADALQFARAAARNFQDVGAGAAAELARAQDLVTELEQRGQ
jgi:tetratricopeptide (TPR) repeat protein